MAESGDVMVGGRLRTWTRTTIILGAVGLLTLVSGVIGRLVAGDEQLAGARQSREVTTTAPPEKVAVAFLEAWEREDWKALQALTADQSLDAAGEHERAHGALGVEETRIEPGEPVTDDAAVRLPYTVTWDLGRLGDVTFDSELTVARRTGADGGENSGWRVRWWYPVLHPDMAPGRRFERVAVWPARAPVHDVAGRPLVQHVGEIVVGVQPDRMADGRDRVLAALEAHTDADLGQARATLARDDLEPGGFYPLVRLVETEFEAARDALLSVPGIVFRRSRGRTPADGGPAGALIGRLGEVTGELLDQLGEPYEPGDTVGRSGLERTYERQLAGAPTEETRIVEGGGLITTLRYEEGTQPQPLQTTLDARVQQAAVGALRGTAQPAALVAVHAPTGEVRAAAWTGDLPIALMGRYPPGSTFKIVDTGALLARGAHPGTAVSCPPDVRLGGRSFTNAGTYGPGRISLLESFARSCNTAFAAGMVSLGKDALVEAAGWFGFGAEYDLGLPSFGGSFPAPADDAELAAAAIGQGRVEASPLHMASVAAAARSGVWRAPHLVRGAPVASRPLPAGITSALDVLMRETVASGTGRAAAVPGGAPVAGKTGSAQFGDGSRTHAWFVGYRGDLAVAVLVQGGGGGGGVAAPIAGEFFRSLS